MRLDAVERAPPARLPAEQPQVHRVAAQPGPAEHRPALVPRAQRYQPRGGVGTAALRPLDAGGQVAQSRALEQHLQRQRHVELAVDPVDQRDGDQRVAADGEELVRDRHVLVLQRLPPGLGQPPLVLGARRDVRAADVGRADGLGGGEGLEVDLAVRGERQGVHDQHPVGKHVVGQQVGQFVLDDLGRALHVDGVLVHALAADLLLAHPAAEEEVRRAGGDAAVGEDLVDAARSGQRVAGLGAVAGGHEAQAQAVALQVVQFGAERDVRQPLLGRAADGGDAERGPGVDGLVDRDHVPGLHDLLRDVRQLAVGVAVEAARQAVHPALVGLDVQLGGPGPGRAGVADDGEGAQVVVLLGDVQPVLDRRVEAERAHVQPVLGQHLLEDAQHVAGLELQHLADVVPVHRLDGAVLAGEVQRQVRLLAGLGGPDPDQAVLDRVVVVQPGREPVQAAGLQVQLGRVQRAG